METKVMLTAKDMAFKAFCENIPLEKDRMLPDWGESNRKERFELWWSDNFVDGQHKDSFYAELSVFIDGKRYIQAE